MAKPRQRSERERAADSFRRQLAAREQRRVREIRARWVTARLRLDKRLDALEARIIAAQAAGEPIRVSWLYDQARLPLLQAEVDAEIRALDDALRQPIAAGRLEAARLGASAAETMTALGLGMPATGGVSISAVWVTASPLAVEAMAGRLTTGAPLTRLLGSLGETVAAEVGDRLTSAIVEGRNPRRVVPELRRLMDAPRWQAERLARTEIVGAYREASTMLFQQNRDVVRGWVWQASVGGACGGCLAMHGSVHDVDEPLSSHPHCRCVAVPLSRSWAELGFAGIDEIDDLNPDAMRADAEAQLAADYPSLAARFGPGKAAAIQDGTISLDDLAARRYSPVWGESVSEATLAEAVDAASRR